MPTVACFLRCSLYWTVIENPSNKIIWAQAIDCRELPLRLRYGRGCAVWGVLAKRNTPNER